MPSQTCSREPSRRFTKRSRWMRLGAFALVFSVGSLWLWNDVGTADTTQANRGFNRVTRKLGGPAQYVPGELIVKFHDSASKATIAAACLGRRSSPWPGRGKISTCEIGVRARMWKTRWQKYRHSPAVEYAEPNYIHRVSPPFLTIRNSYVAVGPSQYGPEQQRDVRHSRCRYRRAGGLGYHHRQLQCDHSGHRHRYCL